jgi:hypothetical protein
LQAVQQTLQASCCTCNLLLRWCWRPGSSTIHSGCSSLSRLQNIAQLCACILHVACHRRRCGPWLLLLLTQLLQLVLQRLLALPRPYIADTAARWASRQHLQHSCQRANSGLPVLFTGASWRAPVLQQVLHPLLQAAPLLQADVHRRLLLLLHLDAVSAGCCCSRTTAAAASCSPGIWLQRLQHSIERIKLLAAGSATASTSSSTCRSVLLPELLSNRLQALRLLVNSLLLLLSSCLLCSYCCQLLLLQVLWHHGLQCTACGPL